MDMEWSRRGLVNEEAYRTLQQHNDELLKQNLVLQVKFETLQYVFSDNVILHILIFIQGLHTTYYWKEYPPFLKRSVRSSILTTSNSLTIGSGTSGWRL